MDVVRVPFLKSRLIVWALLCFFSANALASQKDACGAVVQSAAGRINFQGVNITGGDDYPFAVVLGNLGLDASEVVALALERKRVIGLGEGFSSFVPVLHQNDLLGARAYDPAYGIHMESTDPRLPSWERFQQRWAHLLYSDAKDIPRGEFDLATSHMVVNNLMNLDRAAREAGGPASLLMDHFKLALEAVKPGEGEIRMFGFPKGSESVVKEALQEALRRLGHESVDLSELHFEAKYVTQRLARAELDRTHELNLLRFRRPRLNDPRDGEL